MVGDGKAWGNTTNIFKLATELKHGEQFLDRLIGYKIFDGAWKGVFCDRADEANSYKAGFDAEKPVGNPNGFLERLAAAWSFGLNDAVKFMNESPLTPNEYRGRPARQVKVPDNDPSIYAVPKKGN